MRHNQLRLLAVLGVLGIGELLTFGATEARAQWGGPGWNGGRYKVRVRGRGVYPAPVVAVPVIPYPTTTYVQPTPVVVSETRYIQPAPVEERRVVQPPPIVERRVVQPPAYVESRVIQQPPVVERRVIQPPPIVDREVYSSGYAPY